MRNVAITGIGIVSSLGEGIEAHAACLDRIPPIVTQDFSASYIHPTPPINYDLQIPKKGDQRQMETWQRLGVYTAGLALQNAEVDGKEGLLSKTHMIVAAGGGERDELADEALLSGLRSADNKGAYLNEQLMNNLRPTLFLAQLTNLLAGNISIVHGVTGSSRSFMGEEMAGIDSLRTLYARIASGQVELGLVGAAYNAARKDIMLNYACADLLAIPPYLPVWSRQKEAAGIAFGTMSVFLVLESEEHAKARGAKIWAKLAHVALRRSLRKKNEMKESLEQLYADMVFRFKGEALPVLSCACGAAPITSDEDAFWQGKNAAVRAVGSLAGHGLETQPLLATGLAALSLERKKFFPPFEDAEKALAYAPEKIIVSCCGHWRGESLVLVERAA